MGVYQGDERKKRLVPFFTCLLGFASVLLVLKPSFSEEQYITILLGLVLAI